MFSLWKRGATRPERRSLDKEQVIEDCNRLAEYCPGVQFYVQDETTGEVIKESYTKARATTNGAS